LESEVTLADITGFKSSASRLLEEREMRAADGGALIRIKHPLIGSLTNGLFPDELFLVGAEPGLGKTQLVKEIAYEAARSGFKVKVLALEADVNEWEMREKFEIIIDLYRRDGGHEIFDREDWRAGDADFLEKYEDEADEIMLKNGSRNIETFYKAGRFTPDDFRRQFLAASKTADLFVVDHLQFFSFEKDDSKVEVENLLTMMKELASVCRRPVVLVSHLRKRGQTANFQKLIPGQEDFLGTMAIGGIATKILMLASGGYDVESKNFITYAKLQKNRGAKARTSTVVKIHYDVTADRYLPETVQFGYAKTVGNKEVFQAYTKQELPHFVSRLIGG
jgi:KaiC/GvpD/RAD55 family RecA-like ATPase